jgi:hypothetical protein
MGKVALLPLPAALGVIEVLAQGLEGGREGGRTGGREGRVSQQHQMKHLSLPPSLPPSFLPFLPWKARLDEEEQAQWHWARDQSGEDGRRK